ncbi:MAG: calcium:sodium antiporter [Nitrospirae bacterium RIFCSPLOWO2_02_FULL_62_14]|nr:MAG: calcium:sodium antiporter [Nitrospirae bacterium RIFCSPLOWO2_02_FULL_62_14]
MPTLVAIALFAVGLALILYFAGRLVRGAVGTSVGFGVSPFLISVIFIGFDPENLAVGAVGSFEGVAGIALGSIVGSAMVAIALAFGITALVAPMTFATVPKPILVVPVLAVLLLGLLSWDGRLSRTDGMVLLMGFVLSIVSLAWFSRRGLDIRPAGEVAEALETADTRSKWKSFGLLVLSMAALLVGSEMLVAGATTIIAGLGLSETVFGMTILAFLVSIEELARELPAAMRGRPEISFGNVVGSILAFFLFNAGLIALVRPVPVDAQVLRFYLPVCFGTVVVVSVLMMTKQVTRWAGGLLVLLYCVFAVGGYVG